MRRRRTTLGCIMEGLVWLLSPLFLLFMFIQAYFLFRKP